MIPLKLTLQGLYSYQDQPQTIDFAKLTEAQIFGIFGATGSGKSALLEAMTYALYGKTVRLNQADGLKYNLMNLKSNQFLIDFEFASELTERKHYRITVKARRNSKRFGDITTPERMAYVWEKEEWKPFEVKEIEDIIGLSYENFVRTTIIPQGQFQEFISLGPADRTRMMKELFKLNKYDLGFKAASLDQKNKMAIVAQETLLTQLAAATPAALTEVNDRLHSTAEAQQQATEALKKQEAEAHRMEALKALFERFAAQKQELEALKAQKPGFEKRSETLRQYELCLLQFQPIMQRIDELKDELEKVQKSLQVKQETLEDLGQRLPVAEQSFTKVQQQYLQRAQLLTEAEEYERILELREMEAANIALQKRIGDGKEAIKLKRAEVDDFRLRREQLTEQLAKQRNALPKLSVILELRGWMEQLATLERGAEEVQAKVAEADRQMADCQQRKAVILAQTSLLPAQYTLAFDQLLPIILQTQTQQASELATANEAIASLSAKTQLKQFAETLKEGDPCPLCGATHHPNVKEFEQLDYQLTAQQTAAKQFQEGVSKAQQAHVRLTALAEEVRRIEEVQLDLGKKMAAHQEAIDKHEATFKWPEYKGKDRVALKAELAQVEQANTAIEQLESNREVLDKSLQTETENLERYQKAVELLSGQFQQADATFQASLKALKQVDYTALKGESTHKLEGLAEARRQAHEELETLFAQTEQHLKQLRDKLAGLKGEAEIQLNQEKTTTQKLVKQQKLLQAQLEASDFQQMAEVNELLGLALTPSTERDAINRFHQQLHSAEAAFGELEAQTKGKAYDTAAFDALAAKIAEAQAHITQLTRELGGLQQEQQRLKAQLEEKEKLNAELERLQVRAENIKTLKNLFRSSGFVNYVSTIYLQNLCVAANDRFRKLTRGALHLETKEDNTFIVRDFLNDGQPRSIKTLSGGQTFQAALSLALALADQVQQQAQAKQNFFFIDEGFGTQDREALQAIFETLKSLRRENRIVGIISHVEELQQEIDSYLLISSDPERGSLVKASWEN